MMRFASLFPGVALTIRLVVLVVPLPGLVASSAVAVCPEAEITKQIGRLGNPTDQKPAIAALGKCSNAAGALIWELKNSSEPVRAAAGEALAQIGTDAVIQPLTAALSEPDALTRLYAAQTLGQMGWEAKSAVSPLVRASQPINQTENDFRVRSGAIQALSAISKASVQHSQQLPHGWQFGGVDELRPIQQQLEALLKALKDDKQTWPTKAKDLETLQLAQNGLQTRIETLEEQQLYQVVTWVKGHPVWVAAIGFVGGCIAIYVGIFFLRPLALLRFGDQFIESIAAIPWGGKPASQVLKALLWLKYRPRVLDAWVEQHWQQVQQGFLGLPTVKDRQIHIPLPVRLKDEPTLDKLSSSDLTPTFEKLPAVLLIVAEGGAGKTSLACQVAQWGLGKTLARHRLLPVLIEAELIPTELSDKETLLHKALLHKIQGQLSGWISKPGQPETIPTDLLEHLLKRQRILVIVDHFSEMSDMTRQQIQPESADFPAKALVITSRLEEFQDVSSKTILRPLQIEKNRLLEFIPAYLEAKNKRSLFDDDDYEYVRERLIRITGERPITVLLAQFYIDHVIQEREGAGGVLPDSVPKLMLSYLNNLNQNIDKNRKQDNLKVQQAAKALAWESLKKTYRPIPITKQDAIAALAALPSQGNSPVDDQTAAAMVQYLENPLQLLHTPDPGTETRIRLDPLAEYLAALDCVERHGRHENPETAWREFFAQIDQTLEQSNETSKVIRGFLLALWDCCEDEAKRPGNKLPDFVATELDPKAEVDRQELQRVQENRRIRKLISDLSAPELEFRLEAAEKLSKRGLPARAAAHNLIGMMENPNQEPEARQAAVQTLGKLGIGADALLTLLTNADEKNFTLRRTAAESLGLVKAHQATLLHLLNSNDQPLPLRQGAARALSLIGAPSGEPVPMLIVELQSEQWVPQVKSIPVWREPLTETLSLDLVAIPAGAFVMGSPANEASRDWYARSPYYSDTEGKDVEAQHRVTIPAFSMSQSPITQAQWRFVAGLPKVNRDLALDPASFKGDNRPVETVSWNDAMEFCARLSQHTGKTYRLPSEAEWEYACRAGTTTPFHFGDTLSTDFANYNGNYTYGSGNQGIYREKTTDVGSFGVVNQFGLSDMHGNVWEWCLDHWHPDYENAPTDGSAWETDGDDRYRLLRGGSWFNSPDVCRSAIRNRDTPNIQDDFIGFRVVLPSPWTM